jgi:hypothetical protein
MTDTSISLDSIVDTHLAAYCEPDVERRRTLLDLAWAPDGMLTDPPFAATGLDAIGALTDAVLGHYPDHRFVRTSAVDAHHDHARYAWELRAPDGSAAVSGLDVVTFSDGKITSVTGFFGDLTPRA